MNPLPRLAALSLLAAATALAACAVDVTVVDPPHDGRDGDSTFTWSRRLAPGAQLSIVDGNGPVEVREGTGDHVEIVAVTTVLDRGRAASKVAFGVEESVAGVTICTLYGGARRCADPMRAVNVRTRFTVLLPPGLRLVATTGNGDVVVAGGAASVVATTGNGRISVADVRGAVVATAGNGDVELRQPAGSADATLTTGNGAITATLPATFQGRVEASTGNGVVRSDFPVTSAGVADARHLSGTIGGGGGARLVMTTGNGSVTLRRS